MSTTTPLKISYSFNDSKIFLLSLIIEGIKGL